MLRKLAFSVLFALLPLVALGQSTIVTDADGCIHGRPCAYGVPLPAPNLGAYTVDADGCVGGQPCPWHGWRNNTEQTTVDPQPGNTYLTKRNADGTTDVYGSNARTGSRWDQHYDPNHDRQSGHGKDGRFWTAPLVPPFGKTPESAFPGSLPILDRSDVVIQTAQEPSTTTDQPTGSMTEAEREALAAEYAQAERERVRRAMTAVILSRMQPGVLAEAAALAAARRRCLALADVSGRDACLKGTEQK